MTLGTTTTGDPMELDVERLIGSHACIVANSGGGKSGLIRRLLEVTHGRVQHIVLDGEDEFYTLRERYDYVIAGGDGGDVPATVESAEGLALAALTHGFSLIAQLNDLGFLGAPDFIGRFLNAMVNAPRNLWHPVLVVVDEAQRFVPRQGQSAATEGVRALLAQGRKRGFTAILAGTKFTDIDPSARGGVNNWLLGRVGQALDRKTMANELGMTAKEGRERLGSMEPRNFWAFGPALSREPVLFHVADVETTPIHAGQAKVPTPPAPEALRAILQGLAVVEVPSDQKGVAEDKHEGSVWDSAQVRKVKAELSDVRGQLATAEQDRDTWKRHAETRLVLIERARAALQANGDEIPAPSGGDPAPLPRQEERAAPPKAPRASGAAQVEPPAARAPSPAVRPAHQKVLDALAWWKAAGFPTVERRRGCIMAGYSPKASTFGVYISELSRDGLVEVPEPGQIALTAAGEAVASAPEMTSSTAILEAARALLSPAEIKVFDVVVGDYPQWVSRHVLADRVGLSRTASTLGVYLSKIGSFGFTESGRGSVRAADWLFP